MENVLHYVVVEQGIASVVPIKEIMALELDPYFEGEMYGPYVGYEQAANQTNQFNLVD
jgi:hypothetical protein